MSRLLELIKRPRRTSAHDQPLDVSAGSPAAAAPAAAGPSGGGAPAPAGEDPSDARPTALRRARLRRHLRFLERRRELLLRDLGGLVYEIHRQGQAGDRDQQRRLVSAKVERLATVDADIAAGFTGLGQVRGDIVLREPGVGGSCPACGEIFSSDARFCASCGTAVAGRSVADRRSSRLGPEGTPEPALATAPADREAAQAQQPTLAEPAAEGRSASDEPQPHEATSGSGSRAESR